MDSNIPEIIHFLDDGMTALGLVFYRGQELEITEEVIEQSKDRNDNLWFMATSDEQIDRWGRVRFRPGPWKGKDYEEQEARDAAKVAAKPAFLESAPETTTATPLKVVEDGPKSEYNAMRNRAKMLGIRFTNEAGKSRNPSMSELEAAISAHLEEHGNVAVGSDGS